MHDYVSIHAPVWGATTITGNYFEANSFNPRTRVGCDLQGNGRVAPNHRFNPRTRVGCDIFYLKTQAGWAVSIHAPVWGATFVATAIDRYRVVSIHAPVWGATINSGKMPANTIVSIHAPVWGATLAKAA